MSTFGQYDLDERNRLATAVIEAWALTHAGIDIGLGAAGIGAGIIIPGGGLVATAAALATQYPIYRGLAKELSDVYETPEDIISRRLFRNTQGLDSVSTVVADVAVPAAEVFLVDQLNGEFFGEIIRDMFGEAAIGGILGFLPVVGGIFALGLDLKIAATMTWRVGTMISAYYQNGGRWIGGSRRSTYNAVKPLTGGLSSEIAGRVDLNNLRQNQPEIFETQVAEAMNYIKKSVLKLNPSISRSKLLQHLLELNWPAEIAEEAIRRIMGRE